MIDDETVYHLLDYIALQVKDEIHLKTPEQINEGLDLSLWLRPKDRIAVFEHVLTFYDYDLEDDDAAEVAAIRAYLKVLRKRRKGSTRGNVIALDAPH